MNQTNLMKIILRIFQIIGIAILVVGAVLIIRDIQFISTAAESKGIVIDLLETESRDDNDISYTYKPVVKFKTDQGEERVFKSSLSSNPPRYSIGESVNVLYDLQNENNVEIDGFMTLWFTEFICFFVGIIFLSVSGIALYVLNGGKPSAITYTSSSEELNK